MPEGMHPGPIGDGYVAITLGDALDIALDPPSDERRWWAVEGERFSHISFELETLQANLCEAEEYYL